MKREHTSQDIIDFIIENVEANPKDISKLVSKQFGVSRQSVHRFLSRLVSEKILKAEGNTRDRTYELQPAYKKQFDFTLSPDLQEDKFWRLNILPLLNDVPKNVIDICQYGLTEIMNNVVEHSEGNSGYVLFTMYPNKIDMHVRDYGVGIFKKIAKELNLEDERHAVLELTKGKLTTDKAHHTGEGIFFSSRMFDDFRIFSGTLVFSHTQKDEDSWLLQNESDIKGTLVTMSISKKSSRSVNEVFDKYASKDGDFSFNKTHVPVDLVRYGNEQLVSRSQAKRLLARLEPFKEVFLDFKGIESIGQAFADEIFRVYRNEHSDIRIIWVNTTNNIEKMIKRVTAGSTTQD